MSMALEKSHKCRVVYLSAPLPASGPQNPSLTMFSEGPWLKWDNTVDTIKYIVDFALKNGPFDAIYGFSQGATMATIVSSPSVWRDLYKLPKCPWRFAICACVGATELARSTELEGKKLELPVTLPSLHILGRADALLKEGEAFRQQYQQAGLCTLYHASGHELPMSLCSNKEFQDGLRAFFAGLQEAPTVT